MSEKQMHRQRWHAKLQYAYAHEQWLREEPPMWKLFSWAKWKKRRPVYEEFVK